MYFKMNVAQYGNILICISLDIMTLALFQYKESLKVNVVYFIKLVILWHLKKFVLKYELSLLSYFIIAVLVCFII